MAIQSEPIFKEIDNALAQYYTRLNISNYYDTNGIGVFLHWIKMEELDDPALPIEEELGDACDPNNCTYSWLNQFPLPPHAQIPHDEKDAYIFYVLQYCYKHSKPPSDQYIKDIIVPNCNGTINTTCTLQPSKTTASVDQMVDDIMDECDALHYPMQLLVNQKVEDLENIHWNDLKINASNTACMQKCLTITQYTMVEYCKVALDRLNAGDNHLIPIQVIHNDQYNNYNDTGIEWVLIVHIIHDVGVSFGYNKRSHVYAATAIYLDKDEIDSKNKLIGLKYDYCKQLQSFPLCKLSINGNDDIVANANNDCEELQNQLLEYKKLLFVTTANRLRLEQQMQSNSNILLSHMREYTQQLFHISVNVCSLQGEVEGQMLNDNKDDNYNQTHFI